MQLTKLLFWVMDIVDYHKRRLVKKSEISIHNLKCKYFVINKNSQTVFTQSGLIFIKLQKEFGVEVRKNFVE